MITYEITRKKPPSPGLFERIGIRRAQQQQHSPPNLSAPINLHNRPVTDPYDPAKHSKLQDGTVVEVATPVPAWQAMGKHQYADWLNKVVYPAFPKKTLVTLRSEPYIPGNAPRVYFVVAEIQEIHYMANMDRQVNQPKCLGIKSDKFDIPMWYPPALLRALQPEEVEAVDRIRNQKKPSENSESAGTLIDGTTGEILEKT